MLRTRPLWALKSAAMLGAGPSSLGSPNWRRSCSPSQSICCCHLCVAQPRSAGWLCALPCWRHHGKGAWLVLVLLLPLSSAEEIMQHQQREICFF